MLQTPLAFKPLIRPEYHADTVTLVFHRERLLLRDADLSLPPAAVAASLALATERTHAIGLWQDRYYQAAWVDDDAVPAPGYSYHGLRGLFGQLDEGLLAVAGRAVQVVEWARTHRFCGACGTATRLAEGERCATCPNCGMTAYPRISPAMMVLVRKGDAVLLAMHSASPYKRYTALAGFLEAGESVEEAVHREVSEEVGLRVHNLKYFGSQSWPFPHALMIAYTADYLDGEIRVDPAEIAEACWFGPDDEWPERPVSVSIASELINAHRPPGR